MLRLVIMRHGESLADLPPTRIEGSADFPLSERGQQQAALLGKRIAREYQLDELIASPLQRAQQTAAAIAGATGLTVTTDVRLRERSHGVLGGLTHAEAAERYPLPPGGRKLHEAPPEGESYLEHYQRVAAFWFEHYLGEPADRTVGIVAHGGTIQCLYHAALGLPPLTSAVFGCGDTCVHEWRVEPKGRVAIMLANCTRHLQTPAIEQQ